MANDDLSLTVNGKAYAGWTSIRITRSIETVSGAFELSVSDRWAGQPELWPIMEEDACTVRIGRAVVLTGYVDSREIEIGPDEHTFTVAGRDATGALVDCSSVLSKWEYLNTSVLSLAQSMARPFGIVVALQSGVTLLTPPKVSIDPGDSPLDVIARACKLAGALAIADGKGGLLLTQAGTAVCGTALVLGQNVVRCRAAYRAEKVFRTYIVSGQRAGTDEDFGLGASAVTGTATDPTVKRSTRVTIVRAEGSVTPAQAKRRAQWEAATRHGDSNVVSVRVQGWQQGDGTLWPLNQLVAVKCPPAGVDGQMLITQVVFTQDESGRFTDISLKSPKSFLPQPTVSVPGWKEIRNGV